MAQELIYFVVLALKGIMLTLESNYWGRVWLSSIDTFQATIGTFRARRTLPIALTEIQLWTTR